ncbi:dephospho-CoA kinase [Aquimarina sp. AD1]|uniref:dephospho-CoA kinase n=1 Tax=Aquimarina sp. (strain AD1) TaxID=1714848 RepID=UPI000E4A6352|nr:dephospho-CoA kinase [Aquimarina sp. AD1]AXT54796.1 dephospho-CoA kinase [Aquimarina sp. AD1]RKN05293.1 dephospho-CoA kinase [Aquimarina sp. AD1]
MKVVGLTGGIGSGKSTVAKMFAELGVSVYIADDEAKKLMNEDLGVKNHIVKLLGEKSYIDGELNRPFIADKVFNDKELLKQLNSIVHPAVADHFIKWKNEQKSEYVIKEAAILFENGGYKQCDYTILITAPKETRIQRVLKRDNTTKSQVLTRLKNQWEDSKKIPLADFVIINTKLEETWLQVKKIHNKVIL